MNGKTDQVKGRVEEAVNVLTGDQRLKNRGKSDQAAGKAEDVIGKVIDKAMGAAKGMSSRSYSRGIEVLVSG